jgi:hypothetical protein
VVALLMFLLFALFLVHQADTLRGERRASAVSQKSFKSMTVVAGDVNGCVDGKTAVALPGKHVGRVGRFEEVVLHFLDEF